MISLTDDSENNRQIQKLNLYFKKKLLMNVYVYTLKWKQKDKYTEFLL